MVVGHDIDNPSPCALCMGFCTPDEKNIICHKCMNWFHQSCTKLSNRQFESMSNSQNGLNFECSITVGKKCNQCDTCHSNQINASNSLYCITCLDVICDDCNLLSENQIHHY